MGIKSFSSLILLILMCFVMVQSANAAKTKHSAPVSPHLKVGVLLDFSKYDQNTSKAILSGLELATRHFNSRLFKKQSAERMELVVKDSLGDPKHAAELIETLDKEGVKIVIGPQTDGEIKEVMGYAKSNGMILLSPTSSTSSLAKNGDNLFRFIPNNMTQAKSLTERLKQDGMVATVVVYPDSDSGADGAKTMQSHLSKSKVKVLGSIAYKVDDEGFRRVTADLLKKVSSSREKFQLDQLAIVMVGQTPVRDVFNYANRMPLLQKVRWYNGNLTVGFSSQLPKTDAADFAYLTQYSTSTLGVKAQDRMQRRVLPLLKSKLRGQMEPMAYVGYDMVWIAGEAYFESGISNLKSFKASLQKSAQNYQGLTGPMALNRAGDREFASFETWSVKKRGTRFYWSKNR